MTRWKRGAEGRPVGPGGADCALCHAAHEPNSQCPAESLLALGWHQERPGTWITPASHSRNKREDARRKRLNYHAAQQRLAVPAPLLDAAITLVPAEKERMVASLLRSAGPAESPSFIADLNENTFRAWITAARLRAGGLANDQIARILDTSEELIVHLVRTPSFTHFEAVFRSVTSATPELESVRQKALAIADEALNTAAYWMRQRDWRLAMASLKGADRVLELAGVQSETTKVVIADLSKRQKDKLIEGIRAAVGGATP